jgi:hypothetical protein
MTLNDVEPQALRGNRLVDHSYLGVHYGSKLHHTLNQRTRRFPVKTLTRFKAPVLLVAMLVLLMAGRDADPASIDAAGPAAFNAAANTYGGPVIQAFPAPGLPGPPVYANFAANFMPSDNGTLAIAFYRDPSCIPTGFNLLTQLDVPGAFACELTVEGRVWWHDPATDPFPFQIRLWGLGAVPIYFVDEAELAAAAQDGVLTIGELQALPSLLIGIAEIFEQVIHNSNQARGAQEQQKNKGHEMLNARGTMMHRDLPFFFHYIEEFNPNTGVRTFPTVRIDIG